MIQAKDFINYTLKYGFCFYSGVPCSYLKPLINFVIAHKDLTYVTSVNEGDAVALCSGATVAGTRAVVMLQNSGLGNAVNPLTSLNYIFRIPVLLIVSLRGDTQFPDEPQHELMGEITAKMLEVMKIPWEFFPSHNDSIESVLYRAVSYMDTERRPFALIVRKKDIAPFNQRVWNSNIQSIATVKVVDERARVVALPFRIDMIKLLVEHTPVDKTVIVATTGYTGRELYGVQDRDNQLYLVGSMGCAISFGLGVAMRCKDRKIFVLDGDGALLMRMGAMAAVGHYGTCNLIHIVFNNGVYLSTGGQKTLSDTVDFCKIASACGYKKVIAVNTTEAFQKALSQNDFPCDTFILADVSPEVPDNLPRPKITPFEVVQRLERHIKTNQTG